jgi:hypothetical protein
MSASASVPTFDGHVWFGRGVARTRLVFRYQRRSTPGQEPTQPYPPDFRGYYGGPA